jgi:ABC-type nitrate/sulfonate/bicarbonate transport system substrate-binding protein
MRYSRRQLLKVSTAAAVTAVLPALPRRARAQSVLGAYTLSAPVLVAIEKGFFKAQGVSAEFVPFRGGPDPVKAVFVLVGAAEGTPVRL